MATWSSEQSSALSIGGSETFFSGVTHASGFSMAHVSVDWDFPTGATSDASILLQGSTGDSGSDSWNTQGRGFLSISTDHDPNGIEFNVQGKRRWRVGGQAGSGETANVILRWRIS